MTPEREREDLFKPGDRRVPSQATLYILMAALGWALSAFVGYSAAASSVNARISVLEFRSQAVERRLDSIENKLDQLLSRSQK